VCSALWSALSLASGSWEAPAVVYNRSVERAAAGMRHLALVPRC
jgi:hypothetical protein